MKAAESITPDLLVAAYGRSTRIAGKAPRTFARYEVFLRHFSAWLGSRLPGDVSAREIADDYLAQWFEGYVERKGKAPSADTIRNHHTALSAFYIFLESRDLALSNPMTKLKNERPRGAKKQNDFLTPEEDAAILAAAQTPEERIIIFLLRYAGLRAAEASSLTVSDVDLTQTDIYPYGRILVRQSKTDAGKRVVPIFPELLIELHRWLGYQESRGLKQPTLPLLSTSKRKPMCHDFIWRIVKRVAYRANVRPIACTCGATGRHATGCPRTVNGHKLSEVRPHTLRKTMGTALRREGKSLDVISKLLGHSNTKITENFYIELEADTIAKELFAA